MLTLSIQRTTAAALLAAAAMALSGCGSVFDDLEPCPTAAEMRFVYEYHLEQGNAFPAQVDCLTLHIYDADGRFVETHDVTGPELADENWRMRLDLPAGRYHAVAYGGIACADASFAHVPEPADGSRYTDISMQLLSSHVGKRLHDHFHGTLDFTVSDGTDGTDRVTMYMTKTTNHLRVLLQNLDGTPCDGRDFDITVSDDNSVLDCRNNPVAGRPVVYNAWTSGQLVIEDDDARAGDADPVTLGYAELSTSRIMMGGPSKIRIYSHKAGRVIAELPLALYLSMGKSDADPWGSQEYLDRCSRWNLTFFLDHNNSWHKAYIVVNGWTVRINNTDF